MKWINKFFEKLFGFEWELTKSPAGAQKWKPKEGAREGMVPDANGFHNYYRSQDHISASAEEILVDRAKLMSLTAPELIVLVGEMRLIPTMINQNRCVH